jgi:hypothetical protein
MLHFEEILYVGGVSLDSFLFVVCFSCSVFYPTYLFQGMVPLLDVLVFQVSSDYGALIREMVMVQEIILGINNPALKSFLFHS